MIFGRLHDSIDQVADVKCGMQLSTDTKQEVLYCPGSESAPLTEAGEESEASSVPGSQVSAAEAGGAIAEESDPSLAGDLGPPSTVFEQPDAPGPPVGVAEPSGGVLF